MVKVHNKLVRDNIIEIIESDGRHADYEILDDTRYIEELEKKLAEEYKEYLKSDHWKAIRLKALDRAGYRCQLCSSKQHLNVHHNTYVNRGHEDLKDLVVLCRECHKKFHNIS